MWMLSNHRTKEKEEQQTQLLLAEEERDKLKEKRGEQNPFCLLGIVCAVGRQTGKGGPTGGYFVFVIVEGG